MLGTIIFLGGIFVGYILGLAKNNSDLDDLEFYRNYHDAREGVPPPEKPNAKGSSSLWTKGTGKLPLSS